jgi:hypothetical protein
MPRRRTCIQARNNFELRSGDRVIIRQNPHDLRVEDVVGTVIVFRPGAGFGGCDLVDVHYKDPRTGEGRTVRLGLCCLSAMAVEDVVRLAEYHEKRAATLRQLANSLAEPLPEPLV